MKLGSRRKKKYHCPLFPPNLACSIFPLPRPPELPNIISIAPQLHHFRTTICIENIGTAPAVPSLSVVPVGGHILLKVSIEEHRLTEHKHYT